MHQLEEILTHYGVEGKVEGEGVGPLIKQIRFKPKPGTKIKNITSSVEDIAREMGVKTLRISNVCEGGCIGFEIANENTSIPLIKASLGARIMPFPKSSFSNDSFVIGCR